MTFQATAITIMIASPGDVSEERRIVREIIHDWNDLNSASSKAVLLPIGWETHSSPLLGVRPQERINELVLDKCDLLIGVFWTRIGTPTGEEVSGTVEEIKRHSEAGKPAMLYFSSAPVAPETIDADQYKSLKEFKTWAKSAGLIQEYDDPTAFRELLRKHLSMLVIELASKAGSEFAAPSTVESDPGIGEAARELLLEASLDAHGNIQHMKFLGGTRLRTNGRDFITDETPRTLARWVGALEELQTFGLVTYGQNICTVTARGYEVADALR